MLVTEEEAKTKWCPEVRTGFEGDENRDREWDGSSGKPVPPHYACIGCKCMAWRWREPPEDGNPSSPWRGYCGKGGTIYRFD